MRPRIVLIALVLLVTAACGPGGGTPANTEPASTAPSATPTPRPTLLSGVDAYAPALLSANQLPKALRKLKAVPDASDQDKFLLPTCGTNGPVKISDGAFRQFGSGEAPTAFVDLAGFTEGDAEAAMTDIVSRVAKCTTSFHFQRFYNVKRPPKVGQLPGVDEIVLVHGHSERTAGFSPPVDRYEMVLRHGNYLGSLILVVPPKTVSDAQWVATITTFAGKINDTVG